ncbi:hypothetical protein AA0311_2511 [Asaia bogorensis NBRC 16594]|uniref:Uncharacterized protein n=1 Tax=Asaia bogorensis NBRC 16594 TaxID=1231624 RepID=A0AAN4R1Q2_9PROT|nr:hypothetical protein AA0311_2511 [Asaia bogorensis NBRC 16594]GEL52643.1 hypothetical protein ABO01nite_06500 [Asaia bogorensis NBRC 16594]
MSGEMGVIATDDDDPIGAHESTADRLAKRAGGEGLTVAEADGAIDSDKPHGLAQGGVLQTVIHNEAGCAILGGEVSGFRAVSANPDREVLRQHERFVPHILRGVVMDVHAQWPAQPSTIAAAQYMRALTPGSQPRRQIPDENCLARTAHAEIAAAQDRDARCRRSCAHRPDKADRIEQE